MKTQRVFLVILDSVGIGHAKDAAAFGDEGANTLGHISEQYGLDLPNLQRLGLGNIYPLKTLKEVAQPAAYYTYMEPSSVGKDSVTGHWEFMGCVVQEPFNNFTANGFPPALIHAFEAKTGRKVLANKAANGVQVIKEYGMEQKATGDWIVYTSVDSTFQIAAHEQWIGLEALYKASEMARELTLSNPEWLVSRVIARPFVGDNGNFTRTGNRHDYALNPYTPIALETLKAEGFDVIALGKITDLYNGVGITRAISTQNNADGMEKLIELANESFHGLAFLNLVEFDSVFGHPRDPVGYRQALEAFDAQLPQLLELLHDDDVLIITADHGNDPTYSGNDHTRENVPLLVYSPRFTKPQKLVPRTTFTDIGVTVVDLLGGHFPVGKSFKKELQ